MNLLFYCRSIPPYIFPLHHALILINFSSYFFALQTPELFSNKVDVAENPQLVGKSDRN